MVIIKDSFGCSKSVAAPMVIFISPLPSKFPLLSTGVIVLDTFAKVNTGVPITALANGKASVTLIVDKFAFPVFSILNANSILKLPFGNSVTETKSLVILISGK